MAVASSLEAVPGTTLAPCAVPSLPVMGLPIMVLPGRSPIADPAREKGLAPSCISEAYE